MSASKPMAVLSVAALLLLLHTSVYAQNVSTTATNSTTPSPSGSCFKLTNSQACPDLSNYYIMPSAEFTDVSSFDTYLQGQRDNSTTFIDSFKKAFDCPSYPGHLMRFSQSTTCYLMVSASVQVCPASPPAPAPAQASRVLCKSTCTTYINSLTSIFSNTTMCSNTPSDTAASYRRAAIGTGGPTMSYADFCNTLSTDDLTVCSAGIKTDILRCGFAQASDAAPYCAKNKTDSCCTTIAAQSNAGDMLAPPNRVWWIFGFVAGGLVLIFIIFFIFTRITRRLSRTTTSFQPPDEEKQRGFDNITHSKDPGAAGNLPSYSLDENTNHLSNRTSLFTSIRASLIGIKGKKVKVGSDAPPMPRIPPIPTSSTQAFAGRDSIFSPVSANKANAASKVKNILSMDSVQSGGPNGGSDVKVRVIDDYDRVMEDEIELRVGDIIIVIQEFDDGWAYGCNTETSSNGVFPMSVCETFSPGQAASKKEDNRRSVVTARKRSLLPRN
ncbi:hypothetical protein BASA50_000811 [Batrachochytrium salamandrivorans]|uniref:SH3 domain-containing protein n=1 Tax=Batrachochytrium salamandrivorans TaxID=1357716 RepID=A0ABQ8ET00_9FUNG|nr:hypothetical protein BASA62_000130 [Batrachochytrium salamandrivorans]KAH6586106.1 hypothetical protein BASA50_000811 [Batrachochytrium salamandrivorans]KAH6599702.1 hypothetical protein BASA61_002470 [Batrachochytrium salamandrivorans]KAH9271529.1 hypothetical protein BASA83_006384 [Batrachochytrium salamandrivorans]